MAVPPNTVATHSSRDATPSLTRSANPAHRDRCQPAVPSTTWFARDGCRCQPMSTPTRKAASARPAPDDRSPLIAIVSYGAESRRPQEQYRQLLAVEADASWIELL